MTLTGPAHDWATTEEKPMAYEGTTDQAIEPKRQCTNDALERLEKCAVMLGDAHHNIERLADALAGSVPREAQAIGGEESKAGSVNDRAYRIADKMERRLRDIGEAIGRVERAIHG
jgi:hypothetical protein